MNMLTRPFLRSILGLLVGVLLSVSTVHAAEAEKPAAKVKDPKAMAVIDKVSAYYTGLSSFQVDISATLKVNMQGMKTEMTSTFDCAMARPNKFALVMKIGMMGGTIVSDGTSCIAYQPILNQYTKQDAPKQMGDIMDPMTSALITGGYPLGVEALLAKNPEKALTPDSSVSYVGAEKIGEKATEHIQIVTGPFTTDYWFAEGETPQLIQTDAKIDMSSSLKHLTAEQKSKMPAGFDTMQTSRMASYTNWRTNQPVPDSEFAFQPAPNAKLVESFGAKAGPEPTHPLVGKMAPDFKLKDLDGKEVALSSLRGQTVVLDFWATWCPPCVKTLPIVTKVTTDLKSRGVVFYAVNLREKGDVVREFQKNMEMTFPVLLDEDGKVAELYQAKSIPESVLIDKEGKIAAVHVGFRGGLEKKLTEQLTALLDGKPLEAAAPAPTEVKAETVPSEPAAPAAK